MQNFYEVQEIIGKKQVKNKILYKVKWKGYSIEESTWEKQSNLRNVKELIEKFQQRHSQSITFQANTSKSKQKVIKQRQHKRRQDFSESQAKDSQKDEDQPKIQPPIVESKPIVKERKKRQRSAMSKTMDSNDSFISQRSLRSGKCQKGPKMISKNTNEQKCAKKSKKQRKTSKINSFDIGQESNQESCFNRGDSHYLLPPSFEKENNQTHCSDKKGPNLKKFVKYIENITTQLSTQVEHLVKTAAFRKQYTEELHSENFEQSANFVDLNGHSNFPVNRVSPPCIFLNQSQNEDADQLNVKDTKAKKQTIAKEEKKIFESVGSLEEKLQRRQKDQKVRNINIRLVDSEEEHSDFRQYLVQYEDGTLKVLNSIEIIVAHPLEFIYYLQGKDSKKK